MKQFLVATGGVGPPFASSPKTPYLIRAVGRRDRL